MCLTDAIKTYDAIFSSMFTYDHNESIVQAFYENGIPPPIQNLPSSERYLFLYGIRELFQVFLFIVPFVMKLYPRLKS